MDEKSFANSTLKFNPHAAQNVEKTCWDIAMLNVKVWSYFNMNLNLCLIVTVAATLNNIEQIDIKIAHSGTVRDIALNGHDGITFLVNKNYIE